MRRANLLFLTYLAQVRQLHFKSDNLRIARVLIMPRFLLIQHRKKAGQLRKGIATTGIVHDAVWVGRNKSMVAWSKDAERWQKRTIYISSQSLAKGRK
jgi:hypothetical protein